MRDSRDREAGKSTNNREGERWRERERARRKKQQLAASICYKKSVTNLSERQTKGKSEV